MEGSEIARSITPEGYMLVGIESIDSLSVNYGVKRYKKLAVDFSDCLAQNLLDHQGSLCPLFLN